LLNKSGALARNSLRRGTGNCFGPNRESEWRNREWIGSISVLGAPTKKIADLERIARSPPWLLRTDASAIKRNRHPSLPRSIEAAETLKHLQFEADRDHFSFHRFDSPKKEFALVKGKASQAAEERPPRAGEKGAPTPSFADVARIITGDDNPPFWLVKHFERWAPSLAMARGIAVIQPTRAKTRKCCASIKVTDSAIRIAPRGQ
jgi:hypothetical protein